MLQTKFEFVHSGAGARDSSPEDVGSGRPMPARSSEPRSLCWTSAMESGTPRLGTTGSVSRRQCQSGCQPVQGIGH